MKRIYIIGASILQLPAIKKAKEMGLYVAVADYNPEAIGIIEADEYFRVSTIDEKGIYETAKSFRADGIITLATDMPMRSVAYACEKLNLNSIKYDVAIKSTDKGAMIKAFETAGVEHPWYYIINNQHEMCNIANKVSYPCIIKPTDNSGSRGVILVNNHMEFRDAFQYSSSFGRKGSVIVEEYMCGPEVSVEIVTFKGNIHILQVTDKLTTGYPHFVEMCHSQPCSLGDKNIEEIKDLASRAVEAVGIKNGSAHVEIILTEKGPKMVELGARMGGDCIATHLVPLSTGIDMVKATIQIALGDEPDFEPKLSKASAIKYFNVKAGTIRNIAGIEKAKNIKGIKEIVFTKSIGDKVGIINSSNDRIGYVIAQSSSSKTAVNLCIKAIEQISIVVG